MGRRRAAGSDLILTVAIAIAVAVALALVPARAHADFLVGGAATRGFFDWEVNGGYEHPLPIAGLPPDFPLDVPARIEGHFAYRDNVTHVGLSILTVLRFIVPGFEDNGFSPYLATGPGVHLLGSWASLGTFGDVITDSQATLKWHLLVGARLVRGRTVDLYTEARYTLPSEYDFDSITIGLRFHGAPADSARPGG
jgi:hypothetical protein